MSQGSYFTNKLYQELEIGPISVFNDIPYNEPRDPKRTYDDIPC